MLRHNVLCLWLGNLEYIRNFGTVELQLIVNLLELVYACIDAIESDLHLLKLGLKIGLIIKVVCPLCLKSLLILLEGCLMLFEIQLWYWEILNRLRGKLGQSTAFFHLIFFELDKLKLLFFQHVFYI